MRTALSIPADVVCNKASSRAEVRTSGALSELMSDMESTSTMQVIPLQKDVVVVAP